MRKSKKIKPTWRDLKRQLAELDRLSLLGLIRDLYAAGKDNQAFLNARFALGEDVLNRKHFYLSGFTVKVELKHQ